MKNFVQSGKNMTYSNSSGSAIESGAVVAVGDHYYVAAAKIEDGKSGELITEGVVEIDKDAAAIGQGKVVYIDGSGDASETGTGNLKAIGVCHKAALAGDAKVQVKLIQGIAPGPAE